MQKQFTINVPDELWVDQWTEEKTQTWTYDGPDNYYITLNRNHEIQFWSDVEPTAEQPVLTDSYVTTISADEQTAIAYWLNTRGNITQHEFEDVPNPDGSIYKRITNPSIHDIYDLDFDYLTQKIILRLITRKTETQAEIKAKARLEYVKKYNGVYQFSEEVQAAIDEFILQINAYLDSMAGVYPWKYVTIEETPIPKIPVAVALELAKLDGIADHLKGNV
jgi:hypothetical protein